MKQYFRREYPEDTPLGRLQNVADAYLCANETQRKAIVDLIPEEDRTAFLMFAGLHHLDRDPEFYAAIKKAMAKAMYKEFTEGR